MLDPFLKWAGGKRWLAKSSAWLFPVAYDRYIEPFLGGGAIFFATEPKTALLSDANPRLIATYQAIKDDWEGIVEHLESFAARHSNAHYYVVRGSPEVDPIMEAARFIYLNRTCYNGLYRVNMKGEFNVPRGTKDKVLMDNDDFAGISRALGNASLAAQDFGDALAEAGRGDFVFLDPPYTVAHNNNGFLKYNEKIFSWADQERLKQAAVTAATRGASVLILNAKHSSIETLYADIGTHHVIGRHSVISGLADHRKGVEEIAIQIGYSTIPEIGSPITSVS
jgi:DNA adenine methylase